MPLAGLPPGTAEGCSDESPIRLYGESVERFRTLLSIFYALYVFPLPDKLACRSPPAALTSCYPHPARPPEVQVYNTPTADVDRLLTIAEMTNKYHFTSTEGWAVGALNNVIRGRHGPPQPQYELSHCSSQWMKRLLEVALLCGHTELRDYVAERWVERIIARDLRPVHALEIAERSGVRRLEGYAYYIQMLEMDDDFTPGVAEDGKKFQRSQIWRLASDGEDVHTPAVLTPAQRQRLLSGHWSLTRLWERLRVNPPKFERSDGCTYHQHGCLATWAQLWRDVGKSEITIACASADVLERLKRMEEQLIVHQDLSMALTPQCKRRALLALKATTKEVQDGLADHFADLTADKPHAVAVAAATEKET